MIKFSKFRFSSFSFERSKEIVLYYHLKLTTESQLPKRFSDFFSSLVVPIFDQDFQFDDIFPQDIDFNANDIARQISFFQSVE